MTRLMTLLALLLAAPAAAWAQAQTPAPQQAPQACQSDVAVVTSVKQDVVSLVTTIKNESEKDFETKYHQQTCQSRLNTCLIMTNELLSCLDKAQNSAATPKTQIPAIQLLEATYTKLKNALGKDIQGINSAKKPAKAKALIGAFDF